MMVPPNAHTWWVVAGIFVALLIGSIGRILALRTADSTVVLDRMGSLKTWWGLAVLTVAAVLLGRIGAVLLVGGASLIGLREYQRITLGEASRRLIRGAALSIVPLQYGTILLGWQSVAMVWLPVAGVMFLAGSYAWGGQTAGFVRTVGGTLLGVLVIVFLLSHAALLFTLPRVTEGGAGAAGWFLYLVLLTEANDIAQALTGRRLGRRKICPHVSPKKTWEGLLGGLVVTMLLAALLAPWLTPLTRLPWLRDQDAAPFWGYIIAACTGFALALLGFLGDITMSAVKRDAGVKDGSNLLPGQGGMIDRIDSLSFTAPAIFYLAHWLTEPPVGTGL